MKKNKTHETCTKNTYEATYYIMRGAKLSRVEYISETQYEMYLTGVGVHLKYNWYGKTAEVNATLYARTRIELKKKIREMSKGRMCNNVVR